VFAPVPVEATVVILAEGEVVSLPSRYQLLSGRAVLGASFRVRDLEKVGRMLSEAWADPGAGTWMQRGSLSRRGSPMECGSSAVQALVGEGTSEGGLGIE
jgi:hypothetical protein